MEKENSKQTYSISEVVLAGASSSIGACLLIFLFFSFLASGSHHYLIPTNSDFLIATVWCITSYFSVTLVTVLLKRYLQNFIPSWLVISILGSVVFTSSFWIIIQINSIKNYQPDSPFSIPPPQFSQVIVSVLITSFLFFIFSALASQIAFYAFSKKNIEADLHLE